MQNTVKIFIKFIKKKQIYQNYLKVCNLFAVTNLRCAVLVPSPEQFCFSTTHFVLVNEQIF